MTCGIYKITSPSGRIYIGQSRNIERRWVRYHNEKCINQPRLYNSFRKHGAKSHIFEIVEECKLEHLNIRERYWQDFYKCMEVGLNCILTKTEEKPTICSKETREKISLSNLGKKHSEESRIKMSMSTKGEKNSMFGKKGEDSPMFGKKHSIESRMKMRNAQLISEKNKKKVIDTLTNKIYPSAKEACEDVNLKRKTLTSMLNGYRRNKTSLIYYNENKSQKP